jgi:hypothetical protein
VDKESAIVGPIFGRKSCLSPRAMTDFNDLVHI